jgi:hypothetical protein
MFTAYIDDSGTAPEQKVAIATALVMPAHRIIAFQSEWNTFIESGAYQIFMHPSARSRILNQISLDGTKQRSKPFSKGFDK